MTLNEKYEREWFKLKNLDYPHNEKLIKWAENNDIEEKEVNKSMTKTKVEQHLELVTALNKLYEQKNHDYGDSFGKMYRELGIISAVTRISDKYNRLVSLATKPDGERKVLDESIYDTVRDLANYAIMLAMELDNEKRGEDKY